MKGDQEDVRTFKIIHDQGSGEDSVVFEGAA